MSTCCSFFSRKIYQVAIALIVFVTHSYAGVKTWTGATSTAWGTASNWSPASVPKSKDDITIPVKANMPVFSTGTTTVHSLVIQSGASLTQTGGILNVIGASMQVNGTFNQSAGSVFTDHDFKVNGNGTFNQSGTGLLQMAKSAATNPTAKITIASSGTVNQSGGTIYTKDYNKSPGTFNQTGPTALFKLSHDWKPGAASKFISTAGTVQFTADGSGGANFASGTRQFTNLVVDAGVDPHFYVVANSKIPISGNFTNNNTALSNNTNTTFIFNGSSDQNIYSASTGSNTTFGNLVIKKPSGSAILTSNANISGNMNVLSGTYDLGTYTSNKTSGAGTLMVSAGATVRLAGTSGGQTGSNFPLRLTPSLSKTSTVEYYGSGQNIYATPTYGNLTLSAAGNKTATAALNIAGNINISTATFTAGSFTHNVGGNWTMGSGALTNTLTSNINFNGAGQQTISSTGAFNKLTINKASGSTNITSDVTVNTTLTFTKGVLATGTNKVIIPSSGTVAGASQATGWVNGNLQEFMSTTAGGTFDIGDALNYTPVTENFYGSFTAGSVIASVKPTAQPNIAGSTLASKNINRYWSLSTPATGGVSFTKTALNLNWTAADNFGAIVPANLDVAEYASSAWSYPTKTGSPTATTISVSNLTTLGDFAVGEVSACTVSSAFSYAAPEMCTNSGAQLKILNSGATSGVFTASPVGLSINASTGTITPGTSTPGTYTITNTVVGTCTSTSSTPVKIIAAPAATISYGGASYCQTGGTANVTFSGTTGGIFTSTYGLVIDDVTGQVDLDDSDPGTYTVTYSVSSVAGCGNYTTTANITVTVSNYANIAYPEDAYCLNGGVTPVDFEGTPGGVFSSAAGLSLNTSTGTINLAASTPNTYTVTYSGAAANGCAAYTGIAAIVITAGSPGTISYTGSPYCASGTATATITGQTGGLFSSTAGLEIDEASGDILLDLSTAGTYVVTYSFGGCYTTTSVTVNPPVTITYPVSSTCINTGTLSVTRSGTAGGTYSSDPTLSINAGSGLVDAGLSTSGAYVVTYTVPAAGACPSYQVFSGTINIGVSGLWNGSVSTAWEDAGNWQCNTLPTSTTNVTIPASLTNYPVITAITPEITNLTLQSGAKVTVMNGTFKIRGSISNTGGYIDADSGRIECTGTTAQIIPSGIFYQNLVQDLAITNAVGVTLAGAVRVTGSVGFGNVNNSTLTTGGFLTLASTASATANVLDITNGGVNSSNAISGAVTVERYVPGKRAYRFLSAPVNSTGSIKANWMENTNNANTSVNNNPNPGYGTHITGALGNSNGFDASSTNNPSVFTFSVSGQSWSAIPNTSGTFAAGNGYRVMVRGSRSVNLNDNYATPSATTLRATGTLATGNVTMAKSGGGGTAGMPILSAVPHAYTLIANPYASVVNWSLVSKTDVSSNIYIYDPTISGSSGRGQYVAYNDTLGVPSNVSSMINNNLQSGQAFFVETTGPNPSITFRETYKTTTYRPVFRSAGTPLANLSVTLLLPSQVGTNESADGTRVFFSRDFSNAVDSYDSYKFNNLDENIGVVRDGKTLSIEARNLVTGADSVPLKIWQLTQKEYVLKITLENFDANIEGYLQDKFKKIATPLQKGETIVPFSITSDAASSAPDRFKIVFETVAALPVRLTGIKAYEKNKAVEVEWTAESESNLNLYEIERSGDAQHFVTVGAVTPKNNPGVPAAYQFTDFDPEQGDNYYRLKSVEKSGDVKLSEVVRVQLASGVNQISVINNPVQGNLIKLLFNNVEKGTYRVSLVEASGQKFYSGSILHNGGTSHSEVKIARRLPVGVYQLHLTNGNLKKTIQIVVQ